jgi:CubicO group peptidase (beta-lactamase class C family)
MYRVLALLYLVACGGSEPAPRRALPPPPPTDPVSAPMPPPATQRFAESDPGFAFADPDRRTKLATAFPAIDAAIAEEMRQQDIPGLAIGVVIDGDLAYSKGYGVADVDTKTVPDADTVYRIGSITKSFTALAILALRDDGALALEDPLTNWIPEASGLVYPTRDARPITLRQLLTHTAGLRRETGASKNPDERAFLTPLGGLALETAPGTVWSYSNLGFSLLGLVVGHASGSSLHEVVNKRIFEPLKMSSSVWDRADVPAGRLATAYDETPAGRKPTAEHAQFGAGDGAGGIYSTVRDMARYVAFELSAYPPRDDADDGTVHRSRVRQAHTTGVFSGVQARVHPEAKPGEPSVAMAAATYGFGWEHFHTCDHDDLVAHNGAVDSYRSEVQFLTSHGVGLVVLTNFGHANTGRFADRIFDELAKTGALQPYVAHSTPSPAFDATMTSLLAIYNHWDEAAFTSLLARPAGPGEKDELAGYKQLHGACTAFTPAEVTSPLKARFTMTCERGALDLAVDITPTGQILGFSGVSHRVAVPPEVAKAAVDAMSIIGRWDERAYARSFADPARTHDLYKHGSESLRADHGACKIKELSHEIQWWKIETTCDRGGGIVADMTMTGAKIASFSVHPATEGPCSVR